MTDIQKQDTRRTIIQSVIIRKADIRQRHIRKIPIRMKMVLRRHMDSRAITEMNIDQNVQEDTQDGHRRKPRCCWAEEPYEDEGVHPGYHRA